MSDPSAKRGWGFRLVAKWCDGRAHLAKDQQLLRRCEHAYKTGPLVVPVQLYADALRAEIDRRKRFWSGMAQSLRATADEMEREDGGAP